MRFIRVGSVASARRYGAMASRIIHTQVLLEIEHYRCGRYNVQTPTMQRPTECRTDI